MRTLHDGIIHDRAMRALEERWNTRNDREASEANYMGRDYCMGLEVVHGSQR